MELLLVRIATGMDPAKMSYRRFQKCLKYGLTIRRWLNGIGELPEIAPVKPPDLSQLGL